MPTYLTVTEAAEDTLRKIMAQRANQSVTRVIVTTQGGGTASVKYDAPSRRVTLNLPSLPASAQVSRAHADRITGYVIHEACHVLHTDWAAWTRAVKAGARVRYWTNGLEDMRIEAHEIAHGVYPAMRDLLGRVSDRMFRDALANRAKAGLPAPGTIGTVDAPYVLSVIARLRNGYAIPSARDLEQALSPQTRKLVAYALRWLPKCRDTDACLRLAKQLVALEARMKQADQPEPPPIDDQPPQDTTPQADDTQADDAQADDAQDDDAQDDDAQADDAQDDDAQDDDAQANDAQADDAQADDTQADDAQDDDAQADDAQADDAQADDTQADDAQDDDAQADDAQANDAQADDAQDDDDQQSGPVGTGALDTQAPAQEPQEPQDELGQDDLGDVTQEAAQENGIPKPESTLGLHGWSSTILDKVTEPNEHLAPEHAIRTALNSLIAGKAVLQQEIQRLLVSDELTWRTHHETTGRLDRRALPRIRAGAVDVFTRKHEQPGENTALCVLWDLSSSMRHHHRMPAARALTWELYQACRAAGTMFGAYGFETGEDDPSTLTAPRAYLRPVIAMGEHPTRPAARIAGAQAHGLTGLAPAIPASARLLLDSARDATRHVLLVLTDGDCDYGADMVRDACKVVGAWGVQVIGLGLATDGTIERSFPDRRSVNVADMAELGRRGMRLVNDLLERGA